MSRHAELPLAAHFIGPLDVLPVDANFLGAREASVPKRGGESEVKTK